MDAIKLNIGCGPTNMLDYIGVDIEQYPHVKHNDPGELPYDNGEVSEIYCSHLLSYYSREKGIEVLREWLRVLKYGGVLRIGVPDFDAISRLYQSKKFPIEDFEGPVFGRMGSPVIYHKTFYDERSLSKLLHRAGFTEVKRIVEGFFPWHKDQSWAYLPDRNYSQGTLISLNLIATK